MDNNTIKHVFKEYIHPLDTKVIQKMIDHAQIDKYVKKLGVLTFIRTFIYAQLKELKSLGRISDNVKRKKMVQRLVGIKRISKSQLSRKLGEIPPEIFQVILHHLVQKLHQELGSKQADKALGKIHLIDSSTISMCLSQYEWAVFRETKAGIKLHTSVNFCDGVSYPNDVILTPAKPADVTQLDPLILGKDALHVFDRGYFDFGKFEYYCANGIRFVTRIKANTIVHVIEELPVDPSSAIIRDAMVKIGNMKHPLHLVETLDSKGNLISIVCNDAKVSAQEISDLYRTRWQIELFFKWIKQHLVLIKFYGQSENAVFNQIYIAMITFCLNLLMKNKLGYKGTLLEMFNWVSDFWSKSLSSFIKELFKKPDRTSNGRRKMQHQRIFEETLAQYESGDVLHLDDLTYDPLV
ncbi:IS4 family transposase ISDha2 [Lentibacillus populi]|uniref:IS4 family transposase ISDha2 n=1 Tax=Lentibacillus populi TaxID=1827502 RepID=A0A9W5X7W4_9BACI|nr:MULTISPECIES: IS4 family transposase [Bacillaceae]MBT2218674.1 IS4 family transposase [Virgibacillus dakarensis]GGB63912.1 IS4 family transposase ISDha2 [Lentibacillus populi]